MKIHKGTYENTGKPVHWVESRRLREFTLNDLIDGLCSHYFRNRTADEDDPLPTMLSARKIIEITHEQLDGYGTNALWTWDEESRGTYGKKGRAWARHLILAVLPGLAVPDEGT